MQTFEHDAFSSDPEQRLFSTKIDIRHDTWKNSVEYDTFFYAESNASNFFCPSHLDFTGFPDLYIYNYISLGWSKRTYFRALMIKGWCGWYNLDNSSIMREKKLWLSLLCLDTSDGHQKAKKWLQNKCGLLVMGHTKKMWLQNR